MDSLKQFEKYKLDKKLEKEMAKRIKAKEDYYEALKQKKLELISQSYERKKEKKINKLKKNILFKYKNEIKKLQGKELKQKLPDLTKIKNEAFKEFQEWTKLIKCQLSKWKVIIYLQDKLCWVELSWLVNAGHIYPKQKYPHMAFDLRNVYPISSGTNYSQWDTIGEWIVNLPDRDQRYLKQLAEDKWKKNQLRKHDYYQAIVQKYKPLNLELRRKLWLSLKWTLSGTGWATQSWWSLEKFSTQGSEKQ